MVAYIVSSFIFSGNGKKNPIYPFLPEDMVFYLSGAIYDVLHALLSFE